MSYQWLNGYKTKTHERLDKAGGLLPVEDAKSLAAKLGSGHTYLTLSDPTGVEIVKATAFGDDVKIDRAQGGTEAKTFPAGACIKWEATKMGIEETVCDADFKCQEKLKDVDPCGCQEVIMVLTNFSKYHWPSQRMIATVLTIAVALVGVYGNQEFTQMKTVAMTAIILSGLWLFFDSLFHVVELACSDGYKLTGVCKVADSSRPVFLVIVATGNIFYAADILFTNGMALSGIVFLHIIHAIVFMYILVVDWYIDNSNKLQKTKYKRG